MSPTSGRSLAISPARQRMIDYMRMAQSVPVIYLQRTMHLADFSAERTQTNPRIGWSACFIKAFALAGQVVPQLRWSLLTVPYSRFYVHDVSSATVAVERIMEGEAVVFGFRISQPELRPLVEIDSWLKAAVSDPVEQVQQFRRAIRYGRWPGFVRRGLMTYALKAKGSLRARHFGTFGVSSIHGSGAELLSPRTPLTTILTYGRVGDDGTVTVRLGFDHRVMDGMTAGKALAVMEEQLLTTIRSELSIRTTGSSPSRRP